MQPFYHLYVSTNLNTEHFEANLPENMFVLYLFIYFYIRLPVKNSKYAIKSQLRKLVAVSQIKKIDAIAISFTIL